MSQSVAKKIKLNFIFGILAQAISLIIGIFVPRLFIVSYGSEINGYINSITQIFVYVALLEAGVGTAAMHSLYSPVGQDDKDKISRILSATNRFYLKTAYIYLAIIIALSFVYPLLIDSSLPYPLMVGIFLINGSSGAIAYFFHAKYKILLSVDGRGYVLSAVSSIYTVLVSFGRIILLLAGVHIIFVQSVYLIFNFLQALIFIIYVKKNYPWLDLKAEPDNESISKSKNVLIHQISTLVFNNTDVLILTFFCNLKVVSVYALYKSLVNMVGALINHFIDSINFRLGQMFEDRPRFLKMFDAFETFHITLTFSLCTVAYVFFLPFLRLYTDGMDANYLLTYMPLLTILVEVLSFIRLPSQSVITFAGHFKETQWRSIVETVINLTVSLILVVVFESLWGLGVYGVLIGTVVALIYRTNDVFIYTNMRILNRKPVKVYINCAVCLLISALFVWAFDLVNFSFNGYFTLILAAAVFCIVIVSVQFVVNFAVDRQSGKYVLELFKSRKKTNKERRNE